MRFFQNQLADFVPGSRVEIDHGYWKQIILQTVKSIVDKMPPTFDNCDGGLYVGCAGVAYMFSYLANSEPFGDIKQELLTKARNYTDVSLSYATSKRCRDPPAAFLLGNGGVYATSSLVYHDIGDETRTQELITNYLAVGALCEPVNYLSCGSDELFVGRAGYLCGSLLLNRKFGEVINKDTTNKICKSIIDSGREYSKRNQSPAPLMYSYYDTEYLGAAHGLCAILQMLLNFPDFLHSDPSNERDVHTTVDFMLGLMQPNGNIALAMDEAAGGQRRSQSDELVHWCHGGPGIVYLFAKAFLLWRDEKYLQACLRCGEITWQKGLLKKGPGICHGVAGSGYVFLLLYRLTSDEKHYLRALRFAEFMQTEEFVKEARTPDRPYSLYEGLAGTVCFLADVLQPHRAEFPFFNVF